MTEEQLINSLKSMEACVPSLIGFKDNFCKNDLEKVRQYLTPEGGKEKETQTKDEKLPKKANDFVLINNIGMNVSKISSFFYNSAQQEIYIILEENYGDPWHWFVPLSEGPFILAGIQKTLNDKQSLNFHFTKTKSSFLGLF